jgi:hypothetical protein
MYRLLAFPILLTSALAAFGATDSALLSLVPADAKVVSSVNVQQALTSPFGQFLLKQMNSGPNGFDQMARQTGFDPRRDLETIVMASSGPGPMGKHSSSFVILARGTFQPELIHRQALAKGATVQNINGVDVYIDSSSENVGAEGIPEKNGFAFPDIGVAVMGDLDSVKQVIANRANPATLDASLQALVSQVSANNDAWFATILGGSYLTKHLNEATDHEMKPQAQALQSVRQASGGVRFGDPLQLTFNAVTRSPQDAVSLSDVVRFMSSFVQMQREKDVHAEMLASALDSLVLDTSGNTFHASLTIPEKSLEQLADLGTSGHGFKPAPHRDFTSPRQSQK